jgi:hypothetical protein
MSPVSVPFRRFFRLFLGGEAEQFISGTELLLSMHNDLTNGVLI